MSKILIAIFAGAASGTLGPLIGVGGGIILVPAFVIAMGIEQRNAVATSTAVIFVTTLVAAANYFRSGLVDNKAFVASAIPAMVMAVFASEFMKTQSNIALKHLFAVVLIIVGVKMLFTKAPA